MRRKLLSTRQESQRVEWGEKPRSLYKYQILLSSERYWRQYSERTIYRHATRTVDEKDVFDRRKENKGRPKKLTMRMERIIIRTLLRLRREKVGFTSQKIWETAGLPLNISSGDIKRCLGKYGCNYFQSRKKGLLSAKDKICNKKLTIRLLEEWHCILFGRGWICIQTEPCRWSKSCVKYDM